MRTNYSMKNSSSAIIANIISVLIAFIAQAVFIRVLGAEYLGLNGLFTNILTMLSIFELGIGNAIVYNLYRPIANNDKEMIKSLMLFYRKAYRFIAAVILMVGILIIPFLKYIVGNVTVDINIYIVYILFLISTVSSYFMVYKRNLIIANQRNYIINIIHMIYLVSLNILQLAIICFTKNYYLYLIVKIICQIIENMLITFKANNDYPYLKEKKVQRLNSDIEKDIFSRVKALIFHKVGAIVVNGTDNVIISSFLGIVQVGLYSNYYAIITAVNSLFSQVISSTTASVGNLIVTENESKRFLVFRRLRFLNFWLATFAGTCILVIMEPFIKVWVGEKYLLSTGILVVLVINFYQKLMRNSYSTFKDSAGIWREDKFVPLIESLINIIFSIVLLHFFGMAGVFMGTIISGLALWCYSYPKYVYKKLFKRSYWNFAKETLGYIVIFIIIAAITYGCSMLYTAPYPLLQVIFNTLICLVIPNVILYVIFRKSDTYIYYQSLLKKLSKKVFNKVKNN